MACYRPLTGYRSRSLNPSGKRGIVFTPREGYLDMPIDVPCGQCIGCRLERSRQWAMRCVHEAQMHEHNSFITLTYRDECLPENGSLHKPDFQKFIKNLRYHKGKFRYYYCGEYGEAFKRPHYHACLFGLDFQDKEFFFLSNSVPVFRSQVLDEIWGKGHCSIGEVTFESAAYVARYVTKKITGDKSIDHYEGRLPEYTDMSRRPGIGKPWIDKFKTDVFPSDNVVLRGQKMKPPKFYDKQLSDLELSKIKTCRKIKSNVHKENNTFERLEVREKIQRLKFKHLKRSFENGS